MEFPYRKATKFSTRSLGNLSENLRKKLKFDSNFNHDTFKPLHIPSFPIPRRKPSANLNSSQAQTGSNLDQNLTLESVQNVNLSTSNKDTTISPNPAQHFSLSTTSISDASIPQVWQGIGLNQLTTAQQSQNSNCLQAITPNPHKKTEDLNSPNSAQNIPTIKDFLEEDTQSSIDFPSDLPPWNEQDSSMSFELPQLHGDIDSSVDMDQFGKREVDFDQVQFDRPISKEDDSMISEDFEHPAVAPPDINSAEVDQLNLDISLDNIDPSLENSDVNINLRNDYSTGIALEKSQDVEINSQTNTNEIAQAFQTEGNESTQELEIPTEDTQANELSQSAKITAKNEIKSNSETQEKENIQNQESMLSSFENPKLGQQQSFQNNNKNQVQDPVNPKTENTLDHSSSTNQLEQSTTNTSQVNTTTNFTFWHGVALPSVTNRLNPVKFQPTKPADFLKKPSPIKDQSKQLTNSIKQLSPANQTLHQLDSSADQLSQVKEEIYQTGNSTKKQFSADQRFAYNNNTQLNLANSIASTFTDSNHQNAQEKGNSEIVSSDSFYNLNSHTEYNINTSGTDEILIPVPDATQIQNADSELITDRSSIYSISHSESKNNKLPNTDLDSISNPNPGASVSEFQSQEPLPTNSASTTQPSLLWHGISLSAISNGSAPPITQSSIQLSPPTQPTTMNENATLWHGISLPSVTSLGPNPIPVTGKHGTFSNQPTSIASFPSIGSSIGKKSTSSDIITDAENPEKDIQTNENTQGSDSPSQSKKRLRDDEEGQDNTNQASNEVLLDTTHSHKNYKSQEFREENSGKILISTSKDGEQGENDTPTYQRSDEPTTSLPSKKRTRDEEDEQEDKSDNNNQSPKQSQEEESANFSPLQSEQTLSAIQPPSQPLPSPFYSFPPVQSFTMSRSIIAQGPTLERTPSPTWGSSMDNAPNQNFPVSRTLIAQDPTLERTPSPTWGPSIDMPTEVPSLEIGVEETNPEQGTEENVEVNAVTNPIEKNSQKLSNNKKNKKKNKKKKKNDNKGANNTSTDNNNANTNNNNTNNNNNHNHKSHDTNKQKRANKNKNKYKNKDAFHDYDQSDPGNQGGYSGQDDFAQLLKAYQSQDTNSKAKQTGSGLRTNKPESKTQGSEPSNPHHEDSKDKDDQPRRSSRLSGTGINYNENRGRKKSTT